MSPKAAGQAVKAGFTNVKVLLAGEPAWTKAGYPVYASPDFVKNGNIVLIDLRSIEQAAMGRIAGAVSIPYEQLETRLADIPKKAPVVLYSDDKKEAQDALEILRFDGFKKVSLVPGDINQWLAAGSNVESGPVISEITWERKLGKGEVSVADFQKAVAGGEDVIILDVRTKEEAATGGFKSAVNIPLDEIGQRASELPKDKKIYIHCTTGARAEMAAKELQKQGYNVLCLIADIDCEGEECEIEQ
jgi:rhodanese-related sulfurtransferase